MSVVDRLRRVTDLFVEGRELVFGQDDDGTPIVIWVNKPNSFEVEEARRDGSSARADRIVELKDPTNPETVALDDTMESLDFEELVDMRLEQMSQEQWFNAAQDIEADKAWRERLDYLQRMPTVLADAGAPSDDGRRARLADSNKEYMDEIRGRMETLREEAKQDLVKMDAADLRDDIRKEWRERTSLDTYMQERRVTEIYYSLRDCKATRDTDNSKWDHTGCDAHGVRLLESRGEVRTLPDTVVRSVIALLDELEIGQRTSGNSAAPGSSSASSEPQSSAEGSTASTPDETPPDAPMT